MSDLSDNVEFLKWVAENTLLPFTAKSRNQFYSCATELQSLRDAIRPMLEDYELGVYNHDVVIAVKEALQEDGHD